MAVPDGKASVDRQARWQTMGCGYAGRESIRLRHAGFPASAWPRGSAVCPARRGFEQAWRKPG